MLVYTNFCHSIQWFWNRNTTILLEIPHNKTVGTFVILNLFASLKCGSKSDLSCDEIQWTYKNMWHNTLTSSHLKIFFFSILKARSASTQINMMRLSQDWCHIDDFAGHHVNRISIFARFLGPVYFVLLAFFELV